MTIQDWGSVGELVGAAATVATLFYLATQIRSSTRATRAASAQSVHESFSGWYRMIASEPVLAEIIAKGCRDYASLEESEKGRFVASGMSVLLSSQDAFIKWREGSLSPDLWRSWEYVMMNLLLSPGGDAFWRERSYLFGGAFRDYVDEHIRTREPHPEARPMGMFPIGAPGAGS